MIFKFPYKLYKIITSRIFLIFIAFLFQIGIYISVFFAFKDSFVYFFIVEIIIRVVVVLYIINDTTDPSFKIAWLIAIVFLPYLGSVFYFLLSGGNATKFIKRRFYTIAKREKAVLEDRSINENVIGEIGKTDPSTEGLCRYLYDRAGFPVYRNREAKYFSIGEEYYECLLEELKKAEKFIFIEYFIIQEGKMWDPIFEILKEKAKKGVEIKIIYDDLGCFFTLPRNYPKILEESGIECRVFNPIRVILNIVYNNRDHRKICVIDGKTAFTGGINLADEYINAVERHGHWKDTGIMFRGESVWNYTATFLSMWAMCKKESNKIDFDSYKADYTEEAEKYDGYILPFADSPFDNEIVAQNVYLDIINKARKYVYITTPYLILDEKMVNALSMAAKRGVDVRIMTPHIPDKKIVFMVTRSNYTRLLDGGVRIFEYTPGFLHAKSIIADDERAVVGSINLDYRSLYLHCECGVFMYDVSAIEDIKKDHIKIMEASEEIKSVKANFAVRIARSVLTVFAPLM